jgi:hypothetical protein
MSASQLSSEPLLDNLLNQFKSAHYPSVPFSSNLFQSGAEHQFSNPLENEINASNTSAPSAPTYRAGCHLLINDHARFLHIYNSYSEVISQLSQLHNILIKENQFQLENEADCHSILRNQTMEQMTKQLDEWNRMLTSLGTKQDGEIETTNKDNKTTSLPPHSFEFENLNPRMKIALSLPSQSSSQSTPLIIDPSQQALIASSIKSLLEDMDHLPHSTSKSSESRVPQSSHNSSSKPNPITSSRSTHNPILIPDHPISRSLEWHRQFHQHKHLMVSTVKTVSHSSSRSLSLSFYRSLFSFSIIYYVFSSI